MSTSTDAASPPPMLLMQDRLTLGLFVRALPALALVLVLLWAWHMVEVWWGLRSVQRQLLAALPSPRALTLREKAPVTHDDGAAAAWGGRCVICHASPPVRAVEFGPCGHDHFCARCAVELWRHEHGRGRGGSGTHTPPQMRCPLCRSPVQVVRPNEAARAAAEKNEYHPLQQQQQQRRHEPVVLTTSSDSADTDAEVLAPDPDARRGKAKQTPTARPAFRRGSTGMFPFIRHSRRHHLLSAGAAASLDDDTALFGLYNAGLPCVFRPDGSVAVGAPVTDPRHHSLCVRCILLTRHVVNARHLPALVALRIILSHFLMVLYIFVPTEMIRTPDDSRRAGSGAAWRAALPQQHHRAAVAEATSHCGRIFYAAMSGLALLTNYVDDYFCLVFALITVGHILHRRLFPDAARWTV